MRRHRKLLDVLVIAACISTLLCGCKDTSAETTSTESKEATVVEETSSSNEIEIKSWSSTDTELNSAGKLE